MLEITEHFEYYNRGRMAHLAPFKKIEEWEKYFKCALEKKNAKILFNNNPDTHCFQLELHKDQEGECHCQIKSSYYIGLDQIPKLDLDVYIAPKVNTDNSKLDYISMLLEALTEPQNFDHLEGLIQVKFDENWITIPKTEVPLLTPFLLAQFLILVKSLIKKGLKKSYYTRTENLKGRIRGKLLVGPQVKANILKNRVLDNVCQYQEFGLDSEANQFLKYVLSKVNHYLDLMSHQTDIYKNLKELLDYNLGGFLHVSNKSFKQCKYKEVNSFYKGYNLAISIGNQILKMEDYNIALEQEVESEVPHPPFWIDMSKLFELFVFKQLKARFPGEDEVKYHYTVNRQEPDFILNTESGIKAIVDCKYKPRYVKGNPSMEDSRQLSGYTRLNKIYEELGISQNEVIPAYIIYPANLDKIELQNIDLGEESDEFLAQDIPTNNQNSALFSSTSCRVSSTYKLMYLEEIKLPTQCPKPYKT